MKLHAEQKFDNMSLLTSDHKTKYTSRQILVVPNVINQPIHDPRRSRYTWGINSDPPSHKHNKYKWSSFISLSDQSRHNKTIRRATISYGLMVGNWDLVPQAAEHRLLYFVGQDKHCSILTTVVVWFSTYYHFLCSLAQNRNSSNLTVVVSPMPVKGCHLDNYYKLAVVTLSATLINL